MSAKSYPKEWLEKVPAKVFACLKAGELRLVVMPGGLASEYFMKDIPIDVVPFDLRMPNTNLWLRLDETMRVQEVWKREEEDS